MLGKSKKPPRMDTLVGVNSEIIGDLKFSGGIHIEGKIKGNITAENNSHSLLDLSDKGSIEGDIRAPFIVLNGSVIGNIYCNENIQLSTKACITGDVYYNLIEIATGAQVNGKLLHTQIENGEPLALEHAIDFEAQENDEQESELKEDDAN